MPTPNAPAITRLQLHNFRNYTSLDVGPQARLVALTGDNGAGKTNLLEAISLLTPGRGLRRAEFADLARHESAGGWAVAAEIEGPQGAIHLGTGAEPDETGRKCRVERASVASAQSFAEHLRITWLTPDQDGLFRGSAGDRRRYVDRLVLAVNPEHGSRVSMLERALRNRNRLLDEARPDASWLSAIEREVAEVAIAVAAARAEAISRLSRLILETRHDASAFPHAVIFLKGDLETRLIAEPATAVEDWYRAVLRDNRARDAASGRTLVGPNATDLLVHHGPKGIAAEQASTGEQKALLIGLVVAHARLVHEMSGMVPVMLLDEIAAHLDPKRRQALYGLLTELGGQVWMTGTEPAAFEGLGERGLVLRVSSGMVSPCAASTVA